MKAYEFDEHGKAKEIDIPAEGRDVVDKTRERLVELVAESDDALMEKYFDQGTLDDVGRAAEHQQRDRRTANFVRCTRFRRLTLVGFATLLDHIVEFAPDPAHHEAEHGKNEKGAKKESRKYSTANHSPLIVSARSPIRSPAASTSSRSSAAKSELMRRFTTRRAGSMERLGALHTMQGKQLDKIPEAHAGDIVACVKLKETQTGDTLCDKAHADHLRSGSISGSGNRFRDRTKVTPGRRKDQRRDSQDSGRRSGAFISPATRRQKSFCSPARARFTSKRSSTN